MEQKQQNKGSAVSTVIIVVLVLVVVAGMVWFTKPWERWRAWQDEQKVARAEWLGAKLSSYYDRSQNWPWNQATKGYVPSDYLQRAEAPFVYRPGSGENKDWLAAFFEIENVDQKQAQYWKDNDVYTVLKQISAGRRVGICFQPASAKFQEMVANNCRMNDFGQRDTLGIVDGYDLCEDGLYCVVQE